MSVTTETPINLTANLRDAADWLDAHPDLPAPLFSISAYTEYGVQLSFHVTTDADADALLALTDGGTDHRYDDGDYARIATGSLGSDWLSLSVAVSR